MRIALLIAIMLVPSLAFAGPKLTLKLPSDANAVRGPTRSLRSGQRGVRQGLTRPKRLTPLLSAKTWS